MRFCRACGRWAGRPVHRRRPFFHHRTNRRGHFPAYPGLSPNCDILVNNAGAFFDVPFEQMTFERFDKTYRLNVMAGYFLTQRFAHHWIERGIRGRVVFTVRSMVASPSRIPAPTTSPRRRRDDGEDARGQSRAQRHSGEWHGPGLVRTAVTFMARKPTPSRQVDGASHPQRQVPGPEVCGPAVVYLCSDLAEHVHGQMLLVDGGMSAWQQPDPPK